MGKFNGNMLAHIVRQHIDDGLLVRILVENCKNMVRMK